MIFDVAIGDRVRTVGIVRKGGLLHVDVDGRTHVVDARRVSDSVVSMLVQLDGAAALARSVDAAHEDLAAIAAAVQLFTQPAKLEAAAVATSRWRDAGRVEALR